LSRSAVPGSLVNEPIEQSQLSQEALKLSVEADRAEGYSEPHAAQVADLAERLGIEFGLRGSDLTSLRLAAFAHDWGSRLVRVQNLLAPSRLDWRERLDMWRHPILGEQLAAEHGLPRYAQLLIRWHHESWNGLGYPDGLAGEAIPIGSRILRAVDSYYAMTSDRPYRPRLEKAVALKTLADLAGIEFDPQVASRLAALMRDEPECADTPETESDAGGATFSARMSSSASSRTSWLGFELSVLRRLKFMSIALPFACTPDLGWYLKFWGKEVDCNDLRQSAWWTLRALVENSYEGLGEEDISRLLANDWPEQSSLRNEALGVFLSEPDALWFDRLWLRLQETEQEYKRASGYLHGLSVAHYVNSFDAQTHGLRRPLSEVFVTLWQRGREIIDNGKTNKCSNREAGEFISEARSDVMFTRFPDPRGLGRLTRTNAWLEEVWVRGEPESWEEMVASRRGKLGGTMISKQRYLELIGGFLARAEHIPKWAIAHADEGFLTVSELVATVKTFRPVEAVYSKDFSSVLVGRHAYVIVAG
jgi:hypothetical protein